MVAADVATRLLNARATPVQAVAEVVIAKTPGPVAETLIHLVGRNDKPFLVAGVTIAILGLGAVAGLLTARRRVFGHLVFWAMAAVALVAAMTRPDFTPYSLLPLAVGVIVWTVLLDFLTDLGPAPAHGARVAAPVPAQRRRRRRGRAGRRAGSRFVGRGRQAVETTAPAAEAAGVAGTRCRPARRPGSPA